MELVPKAEFSIVTRASKAWIPELINAAGPEVTETYIDFFTASIRNRNTQQAYARACWQFFDWGKNKEGQVMVANGGRDQKRL
jgi:hypothetical protein